MPKLSNFAHLYKLFRVHPSTQLKSTFSTHRTPPPPPPSPLGKLSNATISLILKEIVAKMHFAKYFCRWIFFIANNIKFIPVHCTTMHQMFVFQTKILLGSQELSRAWKTPALLFSHPLDCSNWSHKFKEKEYNVLIKIFIFTKSRPASYI